MNLNPWKWLRKPEPIDFSDVDLEPEPWQTTLTHDGCVVEIMGGLRDGRDREMTQITVTPLPGYRARYVCRVKARGGAWTIEVYKLKGQQKEEEADNDKDTSP